MIANTSWNCLYRVARPGRRSPYARLALAAVGATVLMVDGCASGVGHRGPLQFDLRGPIAPAAATVLSPAAAPSVFAVAAQANPPLTILSADHARTQGDPWGPTVLLASTEAPAAAADPSLLAGGF